MFYFECESLLKLLKAQNKRAWTSPNIWPCVPDQRHDIWVEPEVLWKWTVCLYREVMKRSLTDSEHFSSRSPRTRRPFKTHKHTGAAGMECSTHTVQEEWAASQTEMIWMMAKLNKLWWVTWWFHPYWPVSMFQGSLAGFPSTKWSHATAAITKSTSSFIFCTVM